MSKGKPFKDDIKQVRRFLLERWLDRLQDAESRYRRQREQSPKGNIPEMTISCWSDDMFNLLVSGIEAALAGKKNPFGISSGESDKVKLDRWARLDVIAEVEKMMAAGTSLEKSCGAVADRLEAGKGIKVKEKTILDAYARTRPTEEEEAIARLWAESNRRLHHFEQDDGVT